MQRLTPPATLDREAEGRAWLGALRSAGAGAEREAAASRLRALLLSAAHFKLSRPHDPRRKLRTVIGADS